MSTRRLRGGQVFDPTHRVDGEVRDVVMRDGRIVTLAPGEPADEEIDASGCIVLAGGIDLHSHIGGGKANLARMLMPGHRCTPGTLETGHRYAEMGYTSVFE